MSLEAKILSLHERITEFERLIWARQNLTGWDDAIKAFIMRRDRLLEEHKAMKAENEAARRPSTRPRSLSRRPSTRPRSLPRRPSTRLRRPGRPRRPARKAIQKNV